MSDKYDLIVIGSGCGGAASAALGSYYGYKTLLLEQNNFIGGRCCTHDINGFKFDHGHIVARSQKGPHGELLRIVKCEDLIPPYAEANYFASRTNLMDHIIEVPDNYFRKFGLFKLYKVSKAFDLSFHELLSMAGFFLKVALISEKKLKSLENVSLEKFIEKYKNNELLITMIGAMSSVSFGSLPDNTSAGELIRTWKTNFKDKSAGYPVTGEGIAAIPLSFLKAAERYGAVIKTGTPADSIHVENNQVKGVVVNGKLIEADIIISNAGLKETAYKLIGKEYFDRDYIKYLDSLKYSYGGLSVKYAIDKPIIKFSQLGKVPKNFMKNMKDALEGRLPDEFSIMLVCTSNIDPALAPEGKQTLVGIAPGPAIEPGSIDWHPWVERFKQQVEELIPGLSEHTVFFEATTPDVIARQNGRYYGDAIGVAQTLDQVGEYAPSPVSTIQNLYYTGADVGTKGIATEMATQSAIDLFEKHIIKKKLKKVR